MANTEKRYDNEFKEGIVRLIRVDKRSVTSVAKDFGLSEQTVRNWLRESKHREDPDKVRITQLETELKEAKRKIADHEMTIEILKKAAAIFVKDNRK